MPPHPATPDYLRLSDDALLAQCRLETFRASGPGGQHRNKADTAVRLRHTPTGLSAGAVESRSQHRNRVRALARLRETIALALRRPLTLDGYRPPATLAVILPTAGRRRLGPRHRDYWRGVQALLDLFVATGCSLSETAERLGLSSGALARFFRADPHLLRAVNQLRGERGLRPLR